MNNKRFGLLFSLFLGLILVLFSFIFRINLLFFNELGQVPIYFWIVLIISFFVFIFYRKKITRKTYNWSYIAFGVISFIYLNSMFYWSVACCPDDYDSMTDWSATKSLSWIIDLPITFIIVLIQGSIFDVIREKRLRN